MRNTTETEDPTIERYRKAVMNNFIPKYNQTKEDLIPRKNFKNLKIKRGVLFREMEHNDSKVEQLVIPNCYKNDVLKGLHNDVGHPGKDRTLRLIRERFFWPNMSSDIEKWVSSCDRCLRRRTNTHVRAPLVNVHTTCPLELVYQ